MQNNIRMYSLTLSFNVKPLTILISRILKISLREHFPKGFSGARSSFESDLTMLYLCCRTLWDTTTCSASAEGWVEGWASWSRALRACRRPSCRTRRPQQSPTRAWAWGRSSRGPWGRTPPTREPSYTTITTCDSGSLVATATASSKPARRETWVFGLTGGAHVTLNII